MDIRLNASEVSNLWMTYISNTATVGLIRSFLQHAEDVDIIKFLEHALHNAEKSVIGSKHLLELINYPIPIGFSESELYVKAPRLFSDKFFLLDIWRLSEYGLAELSMRLNTSLVREVRDFYNDLLILNADLFNEGSDLTIVMGIDVSAPHIPTPENVEFLEKETFYKGLLASPRTINAVEIREIVFSLVGLIHGVALLIGFSQVAQAKDVQEYLLRGKKICSKQANVLQTILKGDDLPTIPTFESEVTKATEPPFSDKLMMFLIVSLAQLAFARYGIAMSMCARNDIVVDIARLMAELSSYAKDGSIIMMEKSWLEQPPMASNRKALIENK